MSAFGGKADIGRMCPQSPMPSKIVIEKLLDPSRVKRRRKLQPVAINPLVVDLSHHNEVADFGKVKAAGIAGIIHKATEAIVFVDNMYAVRRGPAMNAGLLWGAQLLRVKCDVSAMSAFGTKRTSRQAEPMSAFGGKADA